MAGKISVTIGFSNLPECASFSREASAVFFSSALP
jgi:hypothetical protein